MLFTVPLLKICQWIKFFFVKEKSLAKHKTRMQALHIVFKSSWVILTRRQFLLSLIASKHGKKEFELYKTLFFKFLAKILNFSILQIALYFFLVVLNANTRVIFSLSFFLHISPFIAASLVWMCCLRNIIFFYFSYTYFVCSLQFARCFAISFIESDVMRELNDGNKTLSILYVIPFLWMSFAAENSNNRAWKMFGESLKWKNKMLSSTS